MKRICVYCGSRNGARPAYRAAARQLGETFLARRISLVYGGMKGGLMGEIADTVLGGGGEVIGIIPRTLADRGEGHEYLTELWVVDSMTERKGMMASLSDAFVVLPGGVGTLEEFFEIWSWATLGLHRKPCGILNVESYYDRLIQFLDDAVAQGFLTAKHRARVIVEEEPERLLDRFAKSKPA